MTELPADPVKRQVAAHWNRRAPSFDSDFGHSIATQGERAAWNRVLDLLLSGRGPCDALDIGCGTGFLSIELAERGHRVIGVDFAPAMLSEARRKAAERSLSIRFEQADAEQLPFAAGSFDLAISRHLLWTLPHPQAALDEWVRVLRPRGRLAVIDSEFDPSVLRPGPQNARSSAEYVEIADKLPFLGGRPQQEIEALFRAHGLVAVDGDPLADLVAAQEERMVAAGMERVLRRRYLVWGDLPA